ncbi:MAG TPA: DegT/DnrJ/EryC1/StrS family aminotransferase [Vicinamibacterales bacterium]|nr:DegT/DnrJ/EryC1/StrS family aminotransferase [Vicinamibacterales bacterium]
MEDCAQSHGARCGGRMAGTMGDLAAFSFYPTKNLGAMGDGGAVVADNASYAATIRQLQQYGWVSKYRVGLAGGRNSRMDEIQAAVLEARLPHLDAENAERKRIQDLYRLATRKKIRFVERTEGAVVHLAVALCDDRQPFRAFLAERGIASDIHYPVLDIDQEGWAALPSREGPAGLLISRDSSSRIVSLPCFPCMTDAEVGRVTAAIAAWEAS